MQELTHRHLDSLVDDFIRFGQLYGSEAHQEFVIALLEAFPLLIDAARKTIPGELIWETRIPQLVPSVNLNSRGHWASKSSRIKKERELVALVLTQVPRPTLPVTITIVRCAPRLLDDDNAVGVCKGVRDSIAKWMGIDDRDPRVTWKVEQRKVPRKEQGTVVRVERRMG